MLYTEILQKIKAVKINLAQAKKQGETQRENRYKYKLNDLEQKRIKAERENTSEVLKEQAGLIEKLTTELDGYNEINKKLQETIVTLEAKIEGLFQVINPPEPTKIEPEKISCPRCEKWFTEEEMPEHQKGCLTNIY